jgi:hypothetical protein
MMPPYLNGIALQEHYLLYCLSPFYEKTNGILYGRVPDGLYQGDMHPFPVAHRLPADDKPGNDCIAAAAGPAACVVKECPSREAEEFPIVQRQTKFRGDSEPSAYGGDLPIEVRVNELLNVRSLHIDLHRIWKGAEKMIEISTRGTAEKRSQCALFIAVHPWLSLKNLSQAVSQNCFAILICGANDIAARSELPTFSYEGFSRVDHIHEPYSIRF